MGRLQDTGGMLSRLRDARRDGAPAGKASRDDHQRGSAFRACAALRWNARAPGWSYIAGAPYDFLADLCELAESVEKLVEDRLCGMLGERHYAGVVERRRKGSPPDATVPRSSGHAGGADPGNPGGQYPHGALLDWTRDDARKQPQALDRFSSL